MEDNGPLADGTYGEFVVTAEELTEMSRTGNPLALPSIDQLILAPAR